VFNYNEFTQIGKHTQFMI